MRGKYICSAKKRNTTIPTIAKPSDSANASALVDKEGILPFKRNAIQSNLKLDIIFNKEELEKCLPTTDNTNSRYDSCD